ncbi:uncharacterized protein LOC113291493 [Papaver somniferum]|uniref:uncharacterized protein LOC113291493 n=1 Tax=Papaver somniferum TaxID=3469 RepID=UPI000E6F990D|nr:uncharacterized protein LOC113291493 [Papaver somniferum]
MTINGSASQLFRSGKGVKQGDPISPFLFIMVVEVLSLLIKRVASMNLIDGFKPIYNDSACTINHFQFTDDIVVLLNDEVDQVLNLKNILLSFELISGLKVNFRKSAIVVVGNAQNAVECAASFCCSLTSF